MLTFCIQILEKATLRLTWFQCTKRTLLTLTRPICTILPTKNTRSLPVQKVNLTYVRYCIQSADVTNFAVNLHPGIQAVFKFKPDSPSHTIIHAYTYFVTWRMNMETCVPEGYRIHMNDCNVPHNPDDCTRVQPLVNAARIF